MSVEAQAIVYGIALALLAWTAWRTRADAHATGWLGLAFFVLVFFVIAADAALD